MGSNWMKTFQIHCNGTIHCIYYIDVETNISKDQNGVKFEYKTLSETNDYEMIKLG